jgi:cytidylate kinase
MSVVPGPAVAPVLLVTGISASGKSTVAEALARRFARGVHVRGDVFRRMVVSGRAEMSDSPTDEAWRQVRLRYRLAAHAADEYAAAGFTVVVQDVVVGPVLADYVAAIRTRPLAVVVLTPSPAAVARRESGRDKVAYRSGSVALAALDTALRTSTPRLGLWLDTSDMSVDETVDEILRRGPAEALV